MSSGDLLKRPSREHWASQKPQALNDANPTEISQPAELPSPTAPKPKDALESQETSTTQRTRALATGRLSARSHDPLKPPQVSKLGSILRSSRSGDSNRLLQINEGFQKAGLSLEAGTMALQPTALLDKNMTLRQLAAVAFGITEDGVSKLHLQSLLNDNPWLSPDPENPGDTNLPNGSAVSLHA